jgi:Tetratricopeptide repeat
VQVVEVRKMVLGPEHPGTLTSMNNLALTYQSQGQWVEAETIQVHVMETRKTVLGPDHPGTLDGMWNLSYTWKQQGRDSDALAMLEACVQLRNQKLGSNHPDTISAAATLKEWQTSARHRPSASSPPGNSSERHANDNHQPESSTPASHNSQAPDIHHQSYQLVISPERLPPSDDQPQKPRRRDMITKLFHRK